MLRATTQQPRSAVQGLATNDKENVVVGKGKDKLATTGKPSARGGLKIHNAGAHVERTPVKTFSQGGETQRRVPLSNLTNTNGSQKNVNKAHAKVTTSTEKKRKKEKIDYEDIEPCFTTQGKSMYSPYVINDADLHKRKKRKPSALKGTSTVGLPVPKLDEEAPTEVPLMKFDVDENGLIVDEELEEALLASLAPGVDLLPF